MNRKYLIITTLVAAFSLLAAQCGGTAGGQPTATEAPATEAAATQPPAPEPAATEAPATEAVAAQAVTISVWHGYIETEEQVFSQVVSDFQAANPNIKIDVLAVPFTDLQNKFQTEVAAGGGPTLITGPQDRMAGYAQADLLATLPDSAPFLSDLVPVAVEGGKVNGQLVGIPINNKVVAMFYNKSMVDSAPADFDALLSLAADHGMALTADWFHNYMWAPAFGANFFDENYKVVIDSAEGDKAYSYFKQVCESQGVTCDANDGDMDTLFRQGEVAFRFQGPWASADFVNDVGAENVVVTAIPPIPGADYPRPWNQSEMISMNVDATPEQMDAALQFIGYLTSADVQKMFLEKANWIPANANVDTSSNPVVGGFLDQVPHSDPFPVAAELGATWDPMQNAITKILEGVSTPQEALTEAAQIINQANQKP